MSPDPRIQCDKTKNKKIPPYTPTLNYRARPVLAFHARLIKCRLCSEHQSSTPLLPYHRAIRAGRSNERCWRRGVRPSDEATPTIGSTHVIYGHWGEQSHRDATTNKARHNHARGGTRRAFPLAATSRSRTRLGRTNPGSSPCLPSCCVRRIERSSARTKKKKNAEKMQQDHVRELLRNRWACISSEQHSCLAKEPQ